MDLFLARTHPQLPGFLIKVTRNLCVTVIPTPAVKVAVLKWRARGADSRPKALQTALSRLQFAEVSPDEEWIVVGDSNGMMELWSLTRTIRVCFTAQHAAFTAGSTVCLATSQLVGDHVLSLTGLREPQRLDWGLNARVDEMVALPKHTRPAFVLFCSTQIVAVEQQSRDLWAVLRRQPIPAPANESVRVHCHAVMEDAGGVWAAYSFAEPQYHARLARFDRTLRSSELHVLELYETYVADVAFYGTNTLLTCSFSGAVQAFCVRTRAQLWRCDVHSPNPATPIRPMQMSVSPALGVVAIECNYGAQFFDVRTGAIVNMRRASERMRAYFVEGGTTLLLGHDGHGVFEFHGVLRAHRLAVLVLSVLSTRGGRRANQSLRGFLNRDGDNACMTRVLRFLV